ncbi:hypothetical protein V6N13_125222 [Hibiscus sabdariffa]|uniref:Uncharacterized protein n=1 Tax=Hibiscus sabdariffa TaxID=183260 RepID=A0ABR2U524_9ROSI
MFSEDGSCGEYSELVRGGQKEGDPSLDDVQISSSDKGMQVDGVSSEKEVAGSKPKATYASKVASVAKEANYRDNDHGIQSEEIVVLDDDYVIDLLE